MIVFVTCLRHPETSKNYSVIEYLLENTLKSVTSQKTEDFRVIVVGHVKPSFTLPSKVEFVLVDLPAPPVETNLEASRDVFRHDKGQKIAIAVRYAAEYKPSHIVVFDADDLVSCRLAPFLLENGRGNGWYIEKGYMYSPKTQQLALIGGFQRRCGTSLIYHINDLEIPTCAPHEHDRVIELTGVDYFKRVYGSHAQASEHFSKSASSWQAIPFPAAIYVVDTGENHSANRLPSTAKLIPLSAEIKAEFGLSESMMAQPSEMAGDTKAPAVEPASSHVGRQSDRAIIDALQQMLAEERLADADAVARGLLASGDMAWLGHVAAATIAVRGLRYTEAHHLLTSSTDVRSRTLRPDLYISVAFHCSREIGLAAYWDIVELGFQPAAIDAWQIGKALALNHCPVEAEDVISKIKFDSLPANAAQEASWLMQFLKARHRNFVDKDASVILGVIDYKSLDFNRSSTNIGDPVQTLAYLGNLARFSNVEYRSDDGIEKFLSTLQERVPGNLRDSRHSKIVQVVRVNRDSSTYEDLPKGMWLFAFGWYMHHIFYNRFDLPLNENLRPIFISFHVNEPRILTPEALKQMRRFGPVGCRDWSTVNLLRKKNVPAFFTGCITTTIGTILRKDTAIPANNLVGLVEVNAPPNQFPNKIIRKFHHGHPESREASLADNLETAVKKLQSYCALSKIITSRLHCYLPSLAMGIPVDFRPRNPSDIRFAGLAGLDLGNLGTVRDPMLALMNTMLSEILAGKSEDEVYSTWRRETEPLTQVAQP